MAGMWTEQEEELCEKLIEMSEEEFGQVNIDSKNALLEIVCFAGVACRRGNLMLLKACAAWGLNLEKATVTPVQVPLLSIAVIFDQKKIVRFLLEHECLPNKSDVWGRTPATLAGSMLTDMSTRRNDFRRDVRE